MLCLIYNSINNFMTYDLHPIFVHFPIALMLLYSGLRFFSWPKKFPAVNWQIPRIIILGAGIIGAWISSATGEIAARLNSSNRTILEMHEGFAGAATSVYIILLVIELLLFINPDWLKNKYLLYLRPILLFLQNKIIKNWIFRLLAAIGALLIAMTGLLGGIMVYGTAADPLAEPILRLLGL